MKNFFIKASAVGAIVMVAMLVTMTSCEKEDEIVREDLVLNKVSLQQPPTEEFLQNLASSIEGQVIGNIHRIGDNYVYFGDSFYTIEEGGVCFGIAIFVNDSTGAQAWIEQERANEKSVFVYKRDFHIFGNSVNIQIVISWRRAS